MLGLRPLLIMMAPVSVLAAHALAPMAARACSPDPCAETARFTEFELFSTRIATDGVLRFTVSRTALAAMEQRLDFAQLRVFDDGGLERLGALEYHAPTQTVVWRPAEPLTANSRLDVSVRVDNDALAEALNEEGFDDRFCAENIDATAVVEVSDGPLPPLTLPEPESSASLRVDPLERLDSLVCCDGAYPLEEFLCGPAEVYWDVGQCSARLGHGWVVAREGFPDDALSPERLNDFVISLVQSDGPRAPQARAGDPTVHLPYDEPFCARLEVVSLTSGERWTGPEHCYGEELIDQLGPHDIDPSAGLAECRGRPYICETTDRLGEPQWDPEACVDWDEPPGGADTGGPGEGGGSSGGADDEGTGAGDATGSGVGDGTGSGAGALDDPLGDRGCACRATPSGRRAPSAGWLLLITGLTWCRRRRCSGRSRPRSA